MSVIVDLDLPPQEFELGRILEMEGETSVVLETMVPLGERTVPFIRVRGIDGAFENAVRRHDAVNDIRVVSTNNGETLYALDWDISDDTFFEALIAADANLLEALGTAGTWSFNLRFQTHDKLSEFQEDCSDQSIPIDVRRLYNPTSPDSGPGFGLTPPQRAALIRAVEAGYYSIPRETSTKELASTFGISDQALTERLRRAVHNLVTNTLLVSE